MVGTIRSGTVALARPSKPLASAIPVRAIASRSLSSTAKEPRQLQLTLALIKPSVCAYQPDVSAILKEIKQSGLNVSDHVHLAW